MSIRLVALHWTVTQRAIAIRLLALGLVLAAVLLIMLQAKSGAGPAVALNPGVDVPGG